MFEVADLTAISTVKWDIKQHRHVEQVAINAINVAINAINVGSGTTQ